MIYGALVLQWSMKAARWCSVQIIFIASFADLFLVNLLMCPDLKGLHPSGLRNISVPRNLKETKDLDFFLICWIKNGKRTPLVLNRHSSTRCQFLDHLIFFFFLVFIFVNIFPLEANISFWLSLQYKNFPIRWLWLHFYSWGEI